MKYPGKLMTIHCKKQTNKQIDKKKSGINLVITVLTYLTWDKRSFSPTNEYKKN